MDVLEEFSPQLTADQAYELGVRYRIGLGIKYDDSLGYYLSKFAADRGNAKALCNAGLSLIDQKGQTAANIIEGLYLIEKAAEQGVTLAQAFMGEKFYHGKFDGVVDFVKARTWFELGASGGDIFCQHNLAIMLFWGRGGLVDKVAARDWILKAAEQGLDLAQYGLAAMLYNGDGCAVDMAGARDWLLKAAEQGNAPAQRHLARMLFDGKGGPRNIDDAFKYATLASRQGQNCVKLLAAIVATGQISYFKPGSADLGDWATLKAAGMECRGFQGRNDRVRTVTAQP